MRAESVEWRGVVSVERIRGASGEWILVASVERIDEASFERAGVGR